MTFALPDAPPSAPDLEAGAVAVWLARLDDHRARLPALAAHISADERARAARLRRPGDAEAFVIRRGLLRELLAGYLGAQPRIVRFAYRRWGKPVLAGGPRLHFNASSSGDLALFAFALDRPVGVDIERLRSLSDMADVAQRIHSPAEGAAFRALPGAERIAAFFATWTQKEAYVKVLGDGFAAPLDAFAVPLQAPPGTVTRVAGRRIEVLAAPAGYAAAVAADGDGWRPYAATWLP